MLPLEFPVSCGVFIKCNNLFCDVDVGEVCFLIKMAGAEGDRNRSLKEIIYESLNAILSPDLLTRSSGEDQIKALEVTEGKYTFSPWNKSTF